ncbi:coiled-coil domain-containing protein 171-like isoform X2 [Watersipora subatra]|uniref:coiled-coil domain-containing protein 171-like isoform X2 n=1 Tax=Watersipora subatra TaxID=2589382 RepID=UPI00355BFE92
MSSVGEMTADSDSPVSCSQLSSSDDEVLHQGLAGRRKTAFYKANLNDTFDRHIELKSLQAQLGQHQAELAAEREASLSFRKKLTMSNKEKFEQAAKFNEETCRLITENAALQARLERQGELTEQLEFELDRARKQMQNEQKSSTSKSQENAETVEQLEEMLCEAKTRIQTLEVERDSIERGRQAEMTRLQETVADRDRILRETVQEQESVLSERNSLSEVVRQQQETIQQHRSEFSDLKVEFEKMRKHLSDTNHELKSLSATEREHRIEIETLQQMNRELSESIEAEKTSHLESKFNGELVQLKINDVHNSLEHQKCVNEGLQENVDTLTGQLRDLEQAYNEEIVQHRESKAKLDKCEKEYVLSQRQLQSELTDKRTLVTNLKQQLDVHQSNVDDLKSELGRARRRQQYFEETYGGSMRELELLVANFDLMPTSAGSLPREVSSDESKPMSPSAILDTIKHTLRIYKQNLEQTTSELRKVSALYEEVSKEKSNNTDRLWAKERALEDAQRSLSQATKELEVLRRSSEEQDQRRCSLKDDLQSVKKEYDSLQAKYAGLSDELTNTKMTHMEKDEQKMRFIHGLYQRLVVPLSASHMSSKSGKVQSFEKFKWDDLSEMVLEQTVTLLAQVHQLREALAQLDKEVQCKDSQLEGVRGEKEAEVSRLTSTIEKNKELWENEREALKQTELTARADHERQQLSSQKAYDEVWEQMRQTSESVERFERESINLKTRICLLQKHNSSLLCALALMSGAYYPLLGRNKQLSQQRNILEDQLHRYADFKKQVCTLLLTLNSESLGGNARVALQSSRRSALKFRQAALAIIAVRRLRLLQQTAKRVFTFTDSGSSQAVVWLGSLKSANKKSGYTSDSSAEHSDELLSEGDIIDWLSNKEVISTVMSCTEEVMDALKRYSDKEKVCRSGLLISASRTSFKKLVERFGSIYIPSASMSAASPHKERLTLAKRLSKGLQEVMVSCEFQHKSQLLPSQQVLTNLQERVLGFIKLLHDSELERKRLRSKVKSLVSSEQQLHRVEQTAENMELELAVLRNQAERMVNAEQFDGVVEELNQTLAREKRAQQLLDEQNAKLKDVSRKLEEEEVQRVEHEAHIKGLIKCRPDIIHKDVSKILSSKSLLPDCKPSVEMLAVQSLIVSFADSMRALHNHITGINDEIVSHKEHIARLKEELSAACKRQLSVPAIETEFNPHGLLGEDNYGRMQSTRLGHYQDKDITPRFDKSLDLESVEFVSVRNEPEHSNGEVSSVKNMKRSSATANKTSSKPSSSSYRHHSSAPSRRKHDLR